LITFKLIELPKVEEELIELMVELAHIFHLNAMSKCGQLRKLLMSKSKEKPNKLLKEKSQLDKNEHNDEINI
jgi:hypothetical protein